MNKATILGLVRHLLTFGGGILVSKGLLDEGAVEETVGAAVTVIGFLMSVFAKEKRQ